MSQAVTRYHALFESIRTRRRRPETHRGLDLLASHIGMKLTHRRITLAFLRREAQAVDQLDAGMRNYSDQALNEYLRDLREVFARQRQDNSTVRAAMAGIREVARRETGESPYIVQLMGALALYHGRIIEMLTGEGKTLTASIAAPLLAWQYRRLHVLTVNDYLATRDAESRACIYRRCGCTVGAIHQELDQDARFDVYTRSIVYGTPKQITADWLRDQIRLGQLNTPWAGRRLLAAGPGGSGAGPMIPGLCAALVDECDAVLIDEGVVPLIIARSRREDEMATIYKQAGDVARRLDDEVDYKMDHVRRKADLTRRGRHRTAEMCAAFDEPIWRATRRAEELVKQALVALNCYLRGHQYEIVDGRIVIVDEYTGRFLADRSWEHGLHQAVEAKEGVEITADRETLARLSFQRFFRTYPVLCGMTGTAADARIEMEKVYARPVTVIPTNKPVVRERWPTRVFRTSDARWSAVVESIQQIHDQGRPVLVGSRSIEASETLARRLEARGLPHRVLNANFDKEEADLISGAGRHGAITVATNMAGRGTDIKPDAASLKLGGLHVILTEMHSAKRIDRQFFGRAGRQGDPGSCQVFVSLEDELVRLHARRTLRVLRSLTTGLELAGPARRQAIALFRWAQKTTETRARRSRAEVLRQDDWIDKHLPGA